MIIQADILLKSFPADKRLCVVRYLKRYITVTNPLRGAERHLFITYQKPHRRATTATISRWIRTIMEKSGIDINHYKSHSTRAASTSSAQEKQLPVSDILRQAGWANAKTFQKFYLKPVEPDCTSFSRTVLEH